MLSGFRTVVIVVALVAVGAIFSAWINSDADSPQVTISNPQTLTIRPAILASGRLAHESSVNLSSEVIGKVTEILVEEGERVEAGQLVLRIDDEAVSAAVEQNQAAVRLQEIDIERKRLRIENLKRRQERNVRLFETNMMGEDAFEASTLEFQMAEVDFRSTEETLIQSRAALQQSLDRLEKTRVRTPIDGVVTSLDIEVGETAISSTTNIPGSGLMTISDPMSIQTEVFVDEADVANIAVGQPARVVAIAYPNEPLEGKVKYIANLARVEQGRQGLTFLVEIAIDDDRATELQPGMSCRAEIFTSSRDDVLAVPIESVIIDDESGDSVKHFVYVNREESAQRVDVEIGISDDRYQEIVSGLTPTDDVITGPARILRVLKDGDSVSVQTE